MRLSRRAWLSASAFPLIGAAVGTVPLEYRSLSAPVRAELQRLGIDANRWPSWQAELHRETARREQEGEWDHAIFYLLQSREFTSEPGIEPALSARDYVSSLAAAERACYLNWDTPCTPQSPPPDPVRRRIEDLLHGPVSNKPRLREVRRYLGTSKAHDLEQHYQRAMRTLYRKEFGSSPQDTAAFYEHRGHSTDTQVAANYAVWVGLTVLHALDPAFRAEHTLILGPGLDFAPRTEMYDEVPPQSFQPYAVADALLASQLASRPTIHCWDINRRVLRFLEDFPHGPRELQLYTTGGDEDYNRYFAKLGDAIGQSLIGNQANSDRLLRRVRVRKEVAEGITAQSTNVLTGRDLTAPKDLAIATNVLLYFTGAELLIALANLSAQLRPGGYLLVNDTRPAVETYSGLAGMKPVQARVIRIGGSPQRPLTDAFALFQRGAR